LFRKTSEKEKAHFLRHEWVELSQKYLADYLGEDWQEEYYVWDCACGTGNLLAGLTNKYNIWASTLDQADVSVFTNVLNTVQTCLITTFFNSTF
jgi:hypothetical protein